MKKLIVISVISMYGCINPTPKTGVDSVNMQLKCMGGRGSYYVAKCFYRNYGMECIDLKGTLIHCRDYELLNRK